MGFKSFWGLLTCSDVFAGLRESFATLRMCVCVPDASVWSLGLSGSTRCDSALPAGKSGLADTFPGPLELSPPPRTCMRTLSVLGQLLNPSASSVHDLVLLVGKSGFLSLFFS